MNHTLVKQKFRTITSKEYKGNPQNFFAVGRFARVHLLTKSRWRYLGSQGGENQKIVSGSYTHGAFDPEGNLWVAGYRVFGKLRQNGKGEWDFEDLL